MICQCRQCHWLLVPCGHACAPTDQLLGRKRYHRSCTWISWYPDEDACDGREPWGVRRTPRRCRTCRVARWNALPDVRSAEIWRQSNVCNAGIWRASPRCGCADAQSVLHDSAIDIRTAHTHNSSRCCAHGDVRLGYAGWQRICHNPGNHICIVARPNGPASGASGCGSSCTPSRTGCMCIVCAVWGNVTPVRVPHRMSPHILHTCRHADADVAAWRAHSDT